MGIFKFISDLFKEDVIMEPTTEGGKKILATFQSFDDRTLMLFYKNVGGTMDHFSDEKKAILRGELRRRGLY